MRFGIMAMQIGARIPSAEKLKNPIEIIRKTRPGAI